MGNRIAVIGIIVEEPESLRQRLIDTSRKVIALYDPPENEAGGSMPGSENADVSGKEN